MGKNQPNSAFKKVKYKEAKNHLGGSVQSHLAWVKMSPHVKLSFRPLTENKSINFGQKKLALNHKVTLTSQQ